MADEPVKKNSPDEIDLGQLFQMIGRGFNKIGIALLRLFLYLKKNAFILGGLVLLGAGIGYGLNRIIEKKLKIEVIVKPNLDSENYLYGIVDELDNKIKSRDSVFFSSLGAPTKNLGQYTISVEPIEQNKKKTKDNLEYLELLEKFRDDDRFSDIIRKELLKNSSLIHSLTFTFRDADEGRLFSQKVMEYINSTEYYEKLVVTSNENARSRIERNTVLIEQVDLLIANYTENQKKQKNQSLDSRVVIDTEEPMDLTGLLRFKTLLIENMERKKLELKEQTQVINVINFGRVQEIRTSFFSRGVLFFPMIFVGLFFIVSALLGINKLASRLA